MTYVSVEVAVHPASRIFPIDNRLADVMLLKTLTVVVSFEIYGMFSWALSYETMAAPLGNIDLNVGAFVVWRGGWRMRYMPEAPVYV